MPPRRPKSGTDKTKPKSTTRPIRGDAEGRKAKPARSVRSGEKRPRASFHVPEARGSRNSPGSTDTTKDLAAEKAESPDAMRLQKFLAMAGVDSRRNCEEYIRTGRVTVDGEVITDPARAVNPKLQDVKLDSERLKPPRFRYFLVNKPRGVLCTNSDPQGRPRAVDLVPFTDLRMFTVGRLDENTEGMLLVTNDGDLAQQLAHPRFEVIRRYRCLVAGFPQPDILHELREGMYFAEGFFRFRSVRVFKRRGRSTILELELQEGKNREIRRLMARVGHKVLALERIAFGPLKLGSLAPGRSRELSSFEIRQLRQFITKGESSETGPRRTGKSAKFGYRSGQTRGDRKRTDSAGRVTTSKSATSAGEPANPGSANRSVTPRESVRPVVPRTKTLRPNSSEPKSVRIQEKLSTVAGVSKPKPAKAKPSKRKPKQGAGTNRPVRPINKGRDRRKKR